MHRFLIIIEKPLVTILHIPPDLPGCVATGRTKDQAVQNIHEAIELHILECFVMAKKTSGGQPPLSICCYN